MDVDSVEAAFPCRIRVWGGEQYSGHSKCFICNWQIPNPPSFCFSLLRTWVTVFIYLSDGDEGRLNAGHLSELTVTCLLKRLQRPRTPNNFIRQKEIGRKKFTMTRCLEGERDAEIHGCHLKQHERRQVPVYSEIRRDFCKLWYPNWKGRPSYLPLANVLGVLHILMKGGSIWFPRNANKHNFSEIVPLCSWGWRVNRQVLPGESRQIGAPHLTNTHAPFLDLGQWSPNINSYYKLQQLHHHPWDPTYLAQAAGC